MPQVINTNIASINAQRQLNRSQEGSNTALQRLSSGLRINSAKDDAAGLAISTRFSSQIRGTEVAIRNAGDGISLAQTAEGALGSISDSLQRIRELALQSANATNTDLDRAALQEEVDQLKSEIASVAEKTNFNGQKLLDGSFGKQTFQTGANVGDSIDVQISGARADQLGTAQKNGLSSVTTGTTAMAQGDLTINGIAVGASIASADGASTANQDASAIAKAAAINAVADQSGVDAVVNTNTVAGSNTTSVTAGNITINGLAINVPGSGQAGNLATDLAAVAEAINAQSGQTGVTASFDENNLTAGVQLHAEDGRNIVVADGSVTAASVGLGAAATYTGTVTLVSRDGGDITIGSNTGNSLENAGLEIGTYSGANSMVTGGSTTGNLSAGDLVINGVSVGATLAIDDNASTANKDQSGISLAAAINRVSDETGVTATANATQVTSTASGVAANTAGNMQVNGVSINFAAGTTGTTSEQVGLLVDAVNAKSDQTGVTAVAIDEDQYQLIAADGRNIEIAAVTNVGLTAGGTTGSVTLSSGDQINISSNTSTGVNASGLRVGTYGGGESGQLVEDIDISTVAGANKAVQAVDNALQSVASQQGRLGAIQNRFDATVRNLQTSHENLSAANSRIMDADFAKETANMAKYQVLQQAGVSILAQANARSQQVLSLLG